tara:strand:+ start:25442 stop:25864 length:423 start_codon:yes stop_codon:yes gene_type:complete
MLILTNETISERKKFIFNEINKLNDFNHVNRDYWKLINRLPDKFIEKVIGVIDQPSFDITYIEENQIKTNRIQVGTMMNEPEDVEVMYEYYNVLYDISAFNIRLFSMDNSTTDKYFNNYVAKKREKIIDDVLAEYTFTPI